MFSLRTKMEALALVGLLVIGGIVWRHIRSTSVVSVVQSTPTTKVVTVDGPIREKLVPQFIQDPQQQRLIGQLLADNTKLKSTVDGLTSTLATITSSGGDKPNGGEGVITPTPLKVGSFTFKDYQLDATYKSDGSSFTYGLTQGFRIVTTTGKTPAGSRVSLVELFHSTPEGPVRVPSETVEINAPDNPIHWIVSSRIQGGLGYGTSGKEGFVALQWLKFGSTPAAEDVRFSLLSPAVGNNGLTLLPFSYNLGRIKHNPFTNLWVSPTVSLDKTVGVAISSTF